MLCLGPIVRLLTRAMDVDINASPCWDKIFYPSEQCKEEIKFWANNIDMRNGFAIKPNHATSQIVFSDASNYQYDGFLLKRLGKIVCHGKFQEHEAWTSSTERELLAVKYCLL